MHPSFRTKSAIFAALRRIRVLALTCCLPGLVTVFSGCEANCPHSTERIGEVCRARKPSSGDAGEVSSSEDSLRNAVTTFGPSDGGAQPPQMVSTGAGVGGASGAAKGGAGGSETATANASGAGGVAGDSATGGDGVRAEQAGTSSSAGRVAGPSACQPKRCWADADEDGYAAAAATVTETCDECGDRSTATEPASAADSDCGEAAKSRSPGATDICGDNVDNNCDGTPDNEATNACGGPCMMQLPGKPGDPCTNGLKGACTRKGTFGCLSDHSMACSAEAVTGTQEVCGDQSDNDCDGTMDNGCVKNACGGWTKLDRPAGTSCSVGDGACRNAGKYVCISADETGCDAQPKPKNDCGGCAQLAHKPGQSCMGECAATGRWVCRGSDDVVCDAVSKPKNACRGCTTLITEPGSPCIGECGEVGTFQCSGQEATVCKYTKMRNVCGGCNAVFPEEAPGKPCRGPGDPCPATGVWRCEGTGTLEAATICTNLVSGTPNVCGGCNVLVNPTPNTQCIDDNGALGIWMCAGPEMLYCLPNAP